MRDNLVKLLVLSVAISVVQSCFSPFKASAVDWCPDCRKEEKRYRDLLDERQRLLTEKQALETNQRETWAEITDSTAAIIELESYLDIELDPLISTTEAALRGCETTWGRESKVCNWIERHLQDLRRHRDEVVRNISRLYERIHRSYDENAEIAWRLRKTQKRLNALRGEVARAFIAWYPCKQAQVDCDVLDGWYCTGNVREYRNYRCVGGKCVYTVIQAVNCDTQDGWYCSGSVREYRDYSCSEGNCTYTVTQVESCDDGDPCTRDECVGGECIHMPVTSRENPDCD